MYLQLEKANNNTPATTRLNYDSKYFSNYSFYSRLQKMDILVAKRIYTHAFYFAFVEK